MNIKIVKKLFEQYFCFCVLYFPSGLICELPLTLKNLCAKIFDAIMTINMTKKFSIDIPTKLYLRIIQT